MTPREVIDADGNVIKKGMSVVSDGETWVVGYADWRLIRLDQKGSSRFLGRRRFYLCHIIGFQSPLVYL